jgi:hypothetical protein
MGLYTSPATGGSVGPDPVFTGVVTAAAFASNEAGPPAHAGAFRCGPNEDVLVARNNADSADDTLLTVVSSSIYFANPGTINYILCNLYSGGTVFQRFGGFDSVTTTLSDMTRSVPEHGGDPAFAPAPYGSDGMIDVTNPDADYDEIPDNYRYRRLTYLGATTATRGINLPPAANAPGYYEKTIRNQTGNPILVNTVGSIGLGVTIANNRTAIIGFSNVTALRVTADVA